MDVLVLYLFVLYIDQAVQVTSIKKTGIDVYYDDVFDRFRIECCKGDHTLATLEDILKDNSWTDYAKTICNIMERWEQNGNPLKPLVVFASENVSKNICNHLNKDGNEEIKWIPTRVFTQEFEKYSSKEDILDKYHISALCKIGGIKMKMIVNDFENVYSSTRLNFKDCIEGEWNEWEPCDETCREGDKRNYRKRTRNILYPGSEGGHECITVEHEDCTDQLPLCSEQCLLTEWVPWSTCKDGKRIRKRYIRVYNKSCDSVDMEETEDCVEDVTRSNVKNDIDDDSAEHVRIHGMVNDGSGEYLRDDSEPLDEPMVIPRYPSKDNKDFCSVEFKRLRMMCKDNDYVSCFARLKTESEYAIPFFTKCRLEHSMEDKVRKLIPLYKNKCFITRALYSNDSWIDKRHKSCKCSLPYTEPCSIDDIHALMISNSNDKENVKSDKRTLHSIMDPGFCPALSYKGLNLHYLGKGFSGEEASLIYTTIAGNKRLHCPLNKNFKVTDISDSDISFFCKNGSVWTNQHKYHSKELDQIPKLKYDCNDVVSKDKRFKREFCLEVCAKVEAECSKHTAALNLCIYNRMSSDKFEGGEFKRYKCSFPQGEEQSDYCDGVYFASIDNKDECLLLCKTAMEICEYDGIISQDNTKQKCMAAVFDWEYGKRFPNYIPDINHGDNNELEEFRGKCNFSRESYIGKGFVLCKFKSGDCKYTEWSEWSPCTNHCMYPDQIPTKSRTREIIYSRDEFGVEERNCQEDESGTIETVLCTDLPFCEGSLAGDKVLVIPEFRVPQEDDSLPEWITTAYKQYPELREPHRSNIDCKIVRTVRIASLEHVKCGCPKNYRACTFSMATGNPHFIKNLEDVCSENALAQVVFEKVGRYIYYCNIGMVIFQPEDRLLCDSPDSNEYICCYSYRKPPFTLGPIHFLLLGIASATVILIYLLYKRSLGVNLKME
ncbi:hypothetical protein BEWA_024230 [Theileria equi strain WA]|uniref:Thrombospondin type 1 domain-containing protein n=1 Tax=Theileria equi strain WA TaxID=1537102 RepID=L0AXE2_THEEQ|nr:hypothetical protein BEWA_024230 [Theileria equi strain WA]AFZ79574.1 hypothetical protein BEWA_024230 [Theileria equi strain WA]|eukprot:XP_004829240.1 hypothetical protein BEWA_024230 [Theileria equi strain WA]